MQPQRNLYTTQPHVSHHSTSPVTIGLQTMKQNEREPFIFDQNMPPMSIDLAAARRSGQPYTIPQDQHFAAPSRNELPIQKEQQSFTDSDEESTDQTTIKKKSKQKSCCRCPRCPKPCRSPHCGSTNISCDGCFCCCFGPADDQSSSYADGCNSCCDCPDDCCSCDCDCAGCDDICSGDCGELLVQGCALCLCWPCALCLGALAG